MSMSQYPYVGNAATGVVHKKNSNGACRVAEIKKDNRENFQTLSQAVNLHRGDKKPYRACKKCIA